MTQAPASLLTYPFAEIPAPSQVREVAPGVFWVRMPLPFNLNHINLWVLADGEGWTIVDTGINNDGIKDLWRGIAAGPLAGRPLRRLIGTHFHPDHVGLGRWFAETFDLELWMTQEEWLYGKWLGIEDGPAFDTGTRRFYHAAGLLEPEVAFHVARGNGYRPNADGLPHAFRRMVAGERIVIGGTEWEVIVGRGHCPEHACLHAPGLGVLIGGDQVLPRITPNVSVWPNEPEADPLHLFLDSIPAFRGLPEDTLVLPSHGLPYRGLEARLDQLIRHHDERLATALAVTR
ncbi:MAG: MBL fold metallo-hydrolase, partial [Alphaproteobacteria bacterium]|nr:MBL fold metallo-hydrolase [Alphaproteobacteria bacterium]